MLLVCRISVVFHRWYNKLLESSMCPLGPTMLNKQTNQWRSQGLTGWACRPPGSPKWGRKWRKIEEKWGKIQENEENWGNVLILPTREWEVGYSPDTSTQTNRPTNKQTNKQPNKRTNIISLYAREGGRTFFCTCDFFHVSGLLSIAKKRLISKVWLIYFTDR